MCDILNRQDSTKIRRLSEPIALPQPNPKLPPVNSSKKNRASLHKFEFLEVCSKNDDHINDLFRLLLRRTYVISHHKMPPYEEHIKFVKNHPYRKWFLIKFKSHTIGSIYITYSNGIGVNLNDEPSEKELMEILNYIISNFEPLNEIKSVRSNRFHIRANPRNKKLLRAARGIGMKLIEHTYSF